MLLITTNLDAFGVDTSLRDVGFVNRYMIETNGQNFEVTFAANFEVSSHTFSTDDNILQFNVNAVHEKENVAEIVIHEICLMMNLLYCLTVKKSLLQ